MSAVATENSYYFILVFHNMFRPSSGGTQNQLSFQSANGSVVFVLSTHVVWTTLIFIYSFQSELNLNEDLIKI
jgi:hypothetical protein